MLLRVVGLSLLLLVMSSATAQAASPPSRVSVLTMSPGLHPFTRFGHNAILVEWAEPDPWPDLVFNFGTFEFDGVQGARDFMAGRFRYWLSVGTLAGTLRAYSADGRDVTAQELELDVDERARLFAALMANASEEHKYYDYDYYRDNCSTRVRDAVDRVLGGELARQVTGPGALTFRQHTLRRVDDTPWLYFGLDVALGTPTDRPTTRWQELFLPAELHAELMRSQRTLNGVRVPLVRHEKSLVRVDDVVMHHYVDRFRIAVVGVLLGLVLAALGRAAASWRAARALFGLVSALLGAALGLLSLALVVFWASKHWAAHDNVALLAVPPWGLAVAVYGALFALGKARADRVLQRLLTLSVVATSLLLLFALVQTGHESLRHVLLFLPLWCGWLWGARRAAQAKTGTGVAGGALLE